MEKRGTWLYRISTRTATYGVITNQCGIIIDAAPIAFRFLGRHIQALENWLDSKKIKYTIMRIE